MRPVELDALIEQGIDALKAATGLSGEEQQRVRQAIARLEARAEEPVTDSEPEPKAAPSRRSNPRGSAGRKASK